MKRIEARRSRLDRPFLSESIQTCLVGPDILFDILRGSGDVNIFKSVHINPKRKAPIALTGFYLARLEDDGSLNPCGLNSIRNLDDYEAIGKLLWWRARCIIRDINWLSNRGIRTLCKALEKTSDQLEMLVEDGRWRC